MNQEIHPHSISEHLPGFGPTNHFKEFPREMKLNDEFIQELERVSNLDLDSVIDQSFQELQEVYSEEALIEFGNRLGINLQHNIDNQKDISETIKNHSKEVMRARQTSLKNFATELKIDLSIYKDDKTGKWELDEEKFQGIVEDNPNYFKDVVEGKRDITLYDLNHKDKFDPFSSNPNAHSLERVFMAMSHIINKILPQFMQIPTNETQIFKLIKDNIKIQQPSQKINQNKHFSKNHIRKSSFRKKIMHQSCRPSRTRF